MRVSQLGTRCSRENKKRERGLVAWKKEEFWKKKKKKKKRKI
jgi:hypothetical protein